jgi:nucleotide-binding universal stress UspA family protein
LNHPADSGTGVFSRDLSRETSSERRGDDGNVRPDPRCHGFFSRLGARGRTDREARPGGSGGASPRACLRTPPGAAAFGGYIPSASLFNEIEEALRTGAQKSLEPLAEDARRQGVRATPRVLRGVAHSAITEAAAAERADLIVLGTHGRSGLPRFLLGSVAQKVIATATCPVMTVHPLEGGKGGAGKGRGPRRKPAVAGE